LRKKREGRWRKTRPIAGPGEEVDRSILIHALLQRKETKIVIVAEKGRRGGGEGGRPKRGNPYKTGRAGSSLPTPLLANFFRPGDKERE